MKHSTSNSNNSRARTPISSLQTPKKTVTPRAKMLAQARTTQ